MLIQQSYLRSIKIIIRSCKILNRKSIFTKYNVDLNVDLSKQCGGIAFFKSALVKGGLVDGTLNFSLTRFGGDIVMC